MKRMMAFFLAGALGLSGALARADVKYQEETQLKFSGALGTMMKLFGASKPQTSAVYLKGNTLRTDGENSSQIIDLDKEVFIELDHKKKQYTILTFAELKARMEKARQEAEKRMKESKPEAAKESEVKAKFNVSVKPTGQTQVLDGHKTDEAIVTLTIEGQDTSGAKGALITASDMWLAKDLKGYEEIGTFYRRLAEKMGEEWMGGLAKMWGMLSASNPELAQSMQEMKKEAGKLAGTPISTTTSFDVIGTPPKEEKPAEVEEESPKEAKKPSLGGLLGKFGKKKAEEKKKEKETQKAAGGNRSNLMTSTTKMTGFSTAPLSSGLFQIPAGYKEVKKKD